MDLEPTYNETGSSTHAHNKTGSSTHAPFSINTFTLKMIALIAMTIDHIAAFLAVNVSDSGTYLNGMMDLTTYTIFRGIGRLAYPIYCYLIVCGFLHTRNVKKYGLRLLIFAVISQVPYNLANFYDTFELHDLNIFFALLAGLVCIALIDSFKNHKNEKLKFAPAIIIIILLCALYFSDNTYAVLGIIMIITFYYCKNSPRNQFTIITLATLTFSNLLQLFGLVALLPINLHNHRKGPSLKYFFYIYYPLHLLVIYLIRGMLG